MRNLPKALARLLIGLTGVLLVFARPPGAAATTEIEEPRTRVPAPVFAAPTLDGEILDLGQYEGRPVLIHFWATFCAPCREELPSLQKLAERCGDDTLAIITVAVDRGNRRGIEKLRRELGISLPVVLDPEGSIRQSYEVFALPITYALTPDLRIAGRTVGARDWESAEMRDELRGLLGACLP